MKDLNSLYQEANKVLTKDEMINFLSGCYGILECIEARPEPDEHQIKRIANGRFEEIMRRRNRTKDV